MNTKGNEFNTKYGKLPEATWENYFETLVGKVFKILPMKEKEFETLPEYLSSLLLELHGNKSLIEIIKHDGDFLSLLSTLEYFVENDEDVKIYKREVFKCISIVKKLQERYINSN